MKSDGGEEGRSEGLEQKKKNFFIARCAAPCDSQRLAQFTKVKILKNTNIIISEECSMIFLKVKELSHDGF